MSTYHVNCPACGCSSSSRSSSSSDSGSSGGSSGESGSSGGSSGGSGGSEGSSSSSSSSSSGGDPCRHPRICGTGELAEDLLYDPTGVSDGQVWRQPDDRCVYADLHGTDVIYGVPNVYQGNPQPSCEVCDPAPCECPEGLPSSFVFEAHFKSVCNPAPGEGFIECDVSLELTQIEPCLWQGFQSICGGAHNLLIYLTLNTDSCAWALTIPSGDGIYIERPIGQSPAGNWGDGVAEPGQNVCLYGIRIS